MEFKHLKASMVNHKDQQPSVYMALCMVESLFDDLEDEARCDLCECPADHELLPTKMIWLSRVLGEIYEENDRTLQRNRARLDKAMVQLQQMQAELEAQQQAGEELRSLEQEYRQVQAAVEAARETRKAIDAVKANIQQAQGQLSELQSMDLSQQEAELARLEGRIKELENSHGTLVGQIRDKRGEEQTLSGQVAELEAEKNTVETSLRTLQAHQNHLTAEISRINGEIATCTASVAELRQQEAQQTKTFTEKSVELETLQQEIDQYHQMVLAPILKQWNTRRGELDQLEARKAKAEADCQQVQTAHNQLILDISRLKEDWDKAVQQRDSRQKEKERQVREKTLLEAQLTKLLKELGDVQDQVNFLRDRQLPETKKLLQAEQERAAALKQEIAEAEAQQTLQSEEIARMEQELPQVEEKRKNTQTLYDSLTATYTASTTELQTLEQKIAQLQAENGQEKRAIYRRQLEEREQELHKVLTECQQLQTQNETLLAEVEAGNRERNRLQDLQRDYESGKIAIAKLMQELAPVAKPAYAQEAARVMEQMNLLETVRKNLVYAIQMMRQTLGEAPITEDMPLETQLKMELQHLHTYTDALRSVLIRTANSLKMEEQ